MKKVILSSIGAFALFVGMGSLARAQAISVDGSQVKNPSEMTVVELNLSGYDQVQGLFCTLETQKYCFELARRCIDQVTGAMALSPKCPTGMSEGIYNVLTRGRP